MKPNHRAPPSGMSAGAGTALDGAALFDPHNHALAADPRTLHVAVPRGQPTVSPSIPQGPMPHTPKHLRGDGGALGLQALHGMPSMRGLHSARSVPDFHDLYDVPGLDIGTGPGDPFAFDLDFQDPLSPTLYDMPLSASQALMFNSEMSSVGSVASNGSSFIGSAPPVEGLGIAEPGWPPVSSRSRVQQNQPRVTKKSSKQTLRPKRSRANLDQPDRPTSPAPSTSTSSSAALSPPFPTSPRSPAKAAVQLRPMPTVRHVPSTPFPIRGKAAASPAMQSPARPGATRQATAPRLQAAAAATALSTPAAPPPDASRRTSMAAAAAAAAASATQQSTTPGSSLRTPRVSPSTVVASVSGRGAQQQQSAASPTPAARMQSSFKLVSAASDSSPAKGMFSQAQTPLSLSALPKPVQAARKMPSNQSMRRSQARKPPNVIPEMSSAMNQFQIELKPQPPRSTPSAPPTRPPFDYAPRPLGQGAPPFPPQRAKSAGPGRLASPGEPPSVYFDAPSHQPWFYGPGPAPPLMHSVSNGQLSGAQPHSGRLANGLLPNGHLPNGHLPNGHLPNGHLSNGSLPNGPLSNGHPPNGATIDGQIASGAMPNGHFPNGRVMNGNLPQGPPRDAPPHGVPRGAPMAMPRSVSVQYSQVHAHAHPQMHAAPPMPEPPQQMQPVRPKTVVSVSNEMSRVHPQGEPPQHVWVAHPPPPGTPRRRTSRQLPKPGKASAIKNEVEVMAAPGTASEMPPQGSQAARHLSQSQAGTQHRGFEAPAAPSKTASNPVPNAKPVSAPLPSDPARFASSRSSAPPLMSAPPEMLSGHESELQFAAMQEPHPLRELNDGLPAEGGEFAFGLSQQELANQEFLDTLEWAPTELDMDAQWDFMEVLDGQI